MVCSCLDYLRERNLCVLIVHLHGLASPHQLANVHQGSDNSWLNHNNIWCLSAHYVLRTVLCIFYILLHWMFMLLMLGDWLIKYMSVFCTMNVCLAVFYFRNLTSPYCCFHLPNCWLLTLGDALITSKQAAVINSINKLLDIEHMSKQVASSNLLSVDWLKTVTRTNHWGNQLKSNNWKQGIVAC